MIGEEKITKSQKYHRKIKKIKPWVYHWWWAKDRCAIRKSNKKVHKGLPFLLTKTQIKLLWIRDKAKDLLEPSLDRINSRLGYEFFNCRFIEMNINKKRRFIKNEGII